MYKRQDLLLDGQGDLYVFRALVAKRHIAGIDFIKFQIESKRAAWLDGDAVPLGLYPLTVLRKYKYFGRCPELFAQGRAVSYTHLLATFSSVK